ncbi:MAG: outer membrane protein assembly factor [Betaproteobacteria bacterium]|nr:MAG: outer membrane protein assembly factor [Betaproteobacteria bacterium]
MKLRSTLRLRALLLAAALWTSPALAQDGAVAWRIELDAPVEVQSLLEEHLDVYRYRGRPGVDAAMLQRLVARAAADAEALLATAGYFSPQIEVTGTPAAGMTTVLIRVITGPVARVAAADISVTGAIAGEPNEVERIARAKQRWRLKVETPFRQGAWDDAKEALLREFRFDGYPAARITSSAAEVDPEAARVTIKVAIDSGPLFRYGATQIDGLQRYPRNIVENLQRFRSGERYSYEAVVRYQTELQTSGFFRSASVAVDTDPAQAAAAPVRVRVVEHPLMKIDLGAGFSTDTGLRGEASFTHHNTLQPGWQSSTKLRLDSKKQAVNAELALTPEPGGWRNRLGVEAERSDIENLVSRTLGLTAQRAWRTPEEEHNWALKFQTEEQSLTAGPVDNLSALSLNYAWTLRGVDDLLRPRRGHMINLQLGGASAALLSTRSFMRGYGRGLYILPVGRADRVHLRGELGAVWASARDGIPSEFLFRAGGDQSVRGYDYESLGVREGSAVVGGRFLGVATIEYQHDFTAQWGGAMFIDAGNAADSPSELRPVYGYGVGVRWITPAGSLNLDIAQPEDAGKVRLHFTLGVRF